MPLIQIPREPKNAVSDSKRTLIRPLGLGASAIGVPTLACFADTTLGITLFACELVLFTVVFLTALFGTSTVSDRAFRLLRWLADRPEHAGPKREPSA